MTTLVGKNITNYIGDLVQVSNTGTGIDGTLRNLSSGTGTSAAFQVSTAGVKMTGTMSYGSYSVAFGGNFSTTGAFTTVGAFSTTGGAYSLALTLSGNTTLTLPTSGTVVTDSSTNTLTNKTLTAPIIATISNTGTLTLPVSTDTLVGKATTDTLTNKTLTSPKIGTAILDTNGNTQVAFTATASAVNYLTYNNASTGLYPTWTATGSDTNVGMLFQTKGTGYNAFLGTSTSQTQIRLYGTSNAHFINLAIPASPAADRTFTFPDSDVLTQVVQQVRSVTGAVASGSTVIPYDDTIPQNTEGDQYMSLSITPKNSSNILKIDVIFQGSCSLTGDSLAVALFQDSTAGALAVGFSGSTGATQPQAIPFSYTMSAGTTSATTFKIRAGATSGTTTFNGAGAARKYGGVMASSIIITEFSA